jgi:hypothetical protein
MVIATASFFVPGAGHRGYITLRNGDQSNFFSTQEEALMEAEKLCFYNKITLEEYCELVRVIRASSLPSDGTDPDLCEPG